MKDARFKACRKTILFVIAVGGNEGRLGCVKFRVFLFIGLLLISVCKTNIKVVLHIAKTEFVSQTSRSSLKHISLNQCQFPVQGKTTLIYHFIHLVRDMTFMFSSYMYNMYREYQSLDTFSPTRKINFFDFC